MKTTRILSALTLTIGLVGSAAAFDTEGAIEDRLQASPIATPTSAMADHLRYPFQSEGAIHDRLFGGPSDSTGEHLAAVQMGEPRVAFVTEGDIESRLLASFGAGGGRTAEAGERYAFRSEGDIHDQLFGATAPRIEHVRGDAGTRYAFRSEGDFYRLSIAVN